MTPDSAANQNDPGNIYRQRQMEAVAARWDGKAAAWDHDLADAGCHLNEDDAYERFLAQLASTVGERRPFCQEHGVIDAGCATGLVLGAIVPSFAWGIGVDISPEMIRHAAAKQVPKARFLVGDCFDLGAHCPKAGAVVSRGVLLSHYGPDQGQALLRSAFGCLVDAGFILWDFLNRAAWSKYRHVADKKTYFDAEEIRALALQAGFRLARIHGEPERRIRLLYAER